MHLSYPGLEDTICAIATAPGEASIGVVRLSGAQALAILQTVFRTPRGRTRSVWESHRLYLGSIRGGASAEVIDEVLAVCMRAPRSYTGEDVVEIQGHGGSASLQAVVRVLLEAGSRLARPGEFSLRAFVHGRMDLSQAESVIDLIHARTQTALRAALSQHSGRFSKAIHELSESLLDWIAELEAQVDYPEDDIPQVAIDVQRRRVEALLARCDELVAGASAGRLVQEGARLALIGRPNVGKSSLLNALLGENRSIVTDIPGTTRDSIEVWLDVRGVPVRLVDTAGIRQTEDVVEQLGVERSRQVLEGCDLVLLVLDVSGPLQQEDDELLDLACGRPSIVVLNKRDRAGAAQPGLEVERRLEGKGVALPLVAVSALLGEGIDDLVTRLHACLWQGLPVADDVLGGNLRHRDLLVTTRASLLRAQTTLEAGLPPDFVTIDLKAALLALGEITGATVTDEILSRIFTRFCLGK